MIDQAPGPVACGGIPALIREGGEQGLPAVSSNRLLASSRAWGLSCALGQGGGKEGVTDDVPILSPTGPAAEA